MKLNIQYKTTDSIIFKLIIKKIVKGMFETTKTLIKKSLGNNKLLIKTSDKDNNINIEQKNVVFTKTKQL